VCGQAPLLSWPVRSRRASRRGRALGLRIHHLVTERGRSMAVARTPSHSERLSADTEGDSGRTDWLFCATAPALNSSWAIRSAIMNLSSEGRPPSPRTSSRPGLSQPTVAHRCGDRAVIDRAISGVAVNQLPAIVSIALSATSGSALMITASASRYDRISPGRRERPPLVSQLSQA
jgi:hypothetical protein